MKGSYAGVLLLFVWARVLGSDGDTLRLTVEWRDKPVSTEAVTLIGVNVGSRLCQRGRGEPTMLFLQGKRVLLEVEDLSKDVKGRLQVHVWYGGVLLGYAETLLAAELLGKGFACTKPAPPHRYQDLYRAIEAGARAEGRGMWR